MFKGKLMQDGVVAEATDDPPITKAHALPVRTEGEPRGPGPASMGRICRRRAVAGAWKPGRAGAT